ncbi:MAG: hypothetical protein JO154_05300 [Chitinophaga sp.]|uniref:DUF5689 domain-containing protein n=1 Tax=Chitinophaga sp. TaxID=1869181 RepID=UPI0025BDDDC6|nr:DUF5689 domain-containing protein [Chitinophaga sp.]MBV8252006.1 hypothetical protein [Chitinophaga sp.]
MNKIQYRQMSALAILFLLFATACTKTVAPDLSPAIFGTKTISISQLKSLSIATEVRVPDGADGKQISGVVISDRTGKNIDPTTIILQSDGTDTAGIVVQLDTIAPFNPGDWLVINASGRKLQQVNGEVMLKDIPLSRIQHIGKGIIKVISVPVSEALKNASKWNGVLVRFYDGNLTGGGGSYNGTLNFKEMDSTAIISSRVLPGAVFENSTYPAAISAITGILRVAGANPYIQVRNAADVNSTEVTRLVTDEMHIIGMDNPSHYWENPKITFGNTTLETVQSRYYVGDIVGNLPAFPSDAGFLPAQSSYLYLMLQQPVNVWDFKSSVDLVVQPGIKEIRVTFAGSQVNGFITKSTYGDKINVNPFNPATDSFQLDLRYTIGSYVANTVSATYSATGKLYTVVFHVPARRELFKSVSELDPYSYRTSVDQFLEEPKFSIINYSVRVDPNQDPWALPAPAPIIITKIEYGY